MNSAIIHAEKMASNADEEIKKAFEVKYNIYYIDRIVQKTDLKPIDTNNANKKFKVIYFNNQIAHSCVKESRNHVDIIMKNIKKKNY